MNATSLPLPLVEPSVEDAFGSTLSEALKALHVAAGGDAASAGSVAAAVKRVCAAIQEGATHFDLASIEPDTERDMMLVALGASPVVSLASNEHRVASDPLVLDGTRLYLARYWQYERTLEAKLQALNRPAVAPPDDELRALLDTHFSAGKVSPDWQKVAAAAAVLRNLCVISGGPGTGKTTTVVRILAILLTLNSGLRIAIAAPTGKAAARVQESIRLQIRDMGLPDVVKEAMPKEPFTLHRLLGYQSGRATFRHHAGHRLPYDVVVVDEASMLDVALAAKLVTALRDDARLILLGDKDQLSSVEAGAVYSGISSVRSFSPSWLARLSAMTSQALPATIAGPKAALEDAVVWLEHSYRFGADSPLGQLAKAVNAEDAVRTFEILSSGAKGVRWSRALPPVRVLADQLFEEFRPFADAVREGRPPREIFTLFDTFRVLSSTREGTYGSQQLGALLVAALRRHLGATDKQWFIGRPVLVRSNDYALRLFNGDVGIVLPGEGGKAMVHFPTTDGSIRTIFPSRLGATQDAMAITVHRSQGSEFDRVAVVLEPKVTRGLSRQLVYTAVTRAKNEVAVWGQVVAGASS